MPFLPRTRREFFRASGRGLGLLAFAGYAPRFLTHSVQAGAPAPEKDRSILVLLQLAGGNDGLNTVVPFADDRYFRLRPNLALRETAQLHRLTDQLAFHPACASLAGLFHEGRLAVIQNVGYPNPNRSHFRSSEIWETASDSETYVSSGWLGRYFDHACSGQPAASPAASADPAAVFVAEQTPQTLTGDTPHGVFGLDPRNFSRGVREEADRRQLLKNLAAKEHTGPAASFLQHTLMDTLVTEERVARLLQADRPEATYPVTRLGQSLKRVAALIAARLETRVYFVSQTGYDTHAGQLDAHRNLLAELSGALAAFQSDLRSRRLDSQVLTLTFSEFGRRPSENESRGTDHGTAAPLFVLGSGLAGNLLGQAPDLNVRPNQDLTYSTDFRQIYSTLLQSWFHTDPAPILGQSWDPLPLLA